MPREQGRKDERESLAWIFGEGNEGDLTWVGSGKMEEREGGLARGERRVAKGVGGNWQFLDQLGLSMAPRLSHRKGSTSIFPRTRCFSDHPPCVSLVPSTHSAGCPLQPPWPFSRPFPHTQALAQAFAGTAPVSGFSPMRSRACVLLQQASVHLSPSHGR